MDLGCGTGILSLFCSETSPKVVHAIEASSLAKTAKKIIKENGREKIVKVKRTKVEDFKCKG